MFIGRCPEDRQEFIRVLFINGDIVLAEKSNTRHQRDCVLSCIWNAAESPQQLSTPAEDPMSSPYAGRHKGGAWGCSLLSRFGTSSWLLLQTLRPENNET